jgi:hypothetical protein
MLSEVFTAGTMKKAVFWDVTLRGSCKNRWFGRNLLHHHDEKISELGTLLITS